MKTELITEKLSFHVKSFQESFEILCQSSTISQMAKQFDKILRGSFFTTKVYIYHKINDKSEWVDLLKRSGVESGFKPKEIEATLMVNSNKDSTELFTATKLFDSSFIGIGLGKRFDKSKYTEIDKITFQIFTQLFDNAYQVLLSHKKEKGLIFSLNNRVSQLYSLVDTGIEISKIQKANKLLRLSLERAAAITDASKGLLTIKSPSKNTRRIKFPTSNVIIKEIETTEFSISASFKQEATEYTFTLADKESRRGFTQFDPTDTLLLEAVVNQAHAALENVRLHKSEIERENIKRELDVAASIQQRILPDSLPLIEGYDLAGKNIPSKEVGGDYYDCMKLNDGRYALIMADVAGKGVPASLLVSTLNASLTAYLDLQVPLSDLAVKINKIIYKASTQDKFITFLITVLDPESGELDIVNAGHNPGLILRNNGELEKIDAGGVAFGMFDMGLPFSGEKKVLNKGERLFLFTDGIPEAMDKDENEYSDEKLEEFFIKNCPKNADTFVNNIFKSVQKFAGSAPQSDDITALYLIRK